MARACRKGASSGGQGFRSVALHFLNTFFLCPCDFLSSQVQHMARRRALPPWTATPELSCAATAQVASRPATTLSQATAATQRSWSEDEGDQRPARCRVVREGGLVPPEGWGATARAGSLVRWQATATVPHAVRCLSPRLLRPLLASVQQPAVCRRGLRSLLPLACGW